MMIRPLLMFGLIVVFVAIFSLYSFPGWRESTAVLVLFGLAILVGLWAIVADLRALSEQIKRERGDKDGG